MSLNVKKLIIKLFIIFGPLLVQFLINKIYPIFILIKIWFLFFFYISVYKEILYYLIKYNNIDF